SPGRGRTPQLSRRGRLQQHGTSPNQNGGPGRLQRLVGRLPVMPDHRPLSSLRNCDTPPAVGPRLREFGEVRCLYLLDLKTTLRDERRDVPCQVTAREPPVVYRSPPLLPPAHARIW